MTDVTVPEARTAPIQLELSRASLLEAGTGDGDADLARQIVGGATRRGAVARVAPGQLKMIDLWLSADGLVSQGRVADDAVPRPTAIWSTPLAPVGLAEFFKSFPAPGGFGDGALESRYDTVEVLIEAVAAGRVGPGTTLCVLRWRLADGTSRGVVRASTAVDTLWSPVTGDGSVDLVSGSYLDFAAALLEGMG